MHEPGVKANDHSEAQYISINPMAAMQSQRMWPTRQLPSCNGGAFDPIHQVKVQRLLLTGAEDAIYKTAAHMGYYAQRTVFSCDIVYGSATNIHYHHSGSTTHKK